MSDTPARFSNTPGRCVLAFRLAATGTVLARALAVSPIRLLTPRNHGRFAWAFLASLGGGLVDGDRLAVEVDVGEGASALLGTQATTKVYRSARGCSHGIRATVSDGGILANLPDPVVCFAGANYVQNVDVALAPSASLVLLDGYTCGRSARGERWQFARYASRTTVTRGGSCRAFDATWLDDEAGSIAERMGRFDVFLSLLALGPRVAALRESLLASSQAPSPDAPAIAAASSIGADGAILRVAAERVPAAMRVLAPSLAAIADLLGDDPFARKW
jgi:urease accessory protein